MKAILNGVIWKW